MNDELRGSFVRAFGLALLAGLGAFPTALLLIGAVLLGRQIDQAMGTQPVFLITALCVAIPLNIMIMYFLARAAARAAARKLPEPLSTGPSHGSEEEDH